MIISLILLETTAPNRQWSKYGIINNIMTRSMIITDKNILNGKPIIAGTRISVELIMNFLASGMSVEDILLEYKELKRKEVLEAIAYAAELVSRSSSVFSTI